MKYRSFRPGAGGYQRLATELMFAGGLDKYGRVHTEPDGHPRPGAPEFVPYVYRGTGHDMLTAFMDDEPGPAFGPGRPRSQPCGTLAAYRRHLRHGEQPCRACSQANQRASAERRRNR